MSKLRPRPQKNCFSYGWDHLDSFIQDVLSDPSFKVCCVDPAMYSIPKDEIISECISAGYTVEEREDGIYRIFDSLFFSAIRISFWFHFTLLYRHNLKHPLHPEVRK